MIKAALLPDRGILRVAGEDAAHFLNGLVTSDVEKLGLGEARFAALLTPQGKITADFLVVATLEGLLLDCPRQLIGSLAQKLGFYKLRAKVIIEDLSNVLGVTALWGAEKFSSDAFVVFADSRAADLGYRMIVPNAQIEQAVRALGVELQDEASYEAHRIACGVPKGGVDFCYGDAFPHESNMDRNGGVDFTKGCYVGQEVVSRMQHRGTARTRVVQVTFSGPPPAPGAEITTGTRPLGTMGSSTTGKGLAMLRLDRTGDALQQGALVTANGVALGINLADLQMPETRLLP